MRSFVLTWLTCAGLLTSSGCSEPAQNQQPLGEARAGHKNPEIDRAKGAQEFGDTAGRQTKLDSPKKVDLADVTRASRDIGHTAGRSASEDTPQTELRQDLRVPDRFTKPEVKSPEVAERLELYEHKWGDLDQLVAENAPAEGTMSHRFREAIRSSLVSDIREYTSRIDTEHNMAEAYLRRGWAQQRLGRYRAAMDDFDRAREIDFSHRQSDFVLGDEMALAWLLAVCPDPAYRDGKRALRLAKFGCQETSFQKAAYLDTLAAAYAESGDFGNATHWQERACEMKPNAAFQRRLELFRQHRPYRERSIE